MGHYLVNPAATKKAPDLLVVIPLYNEEEAIEGVIREWYLELQSLLEGRFQFLIINDGSEDQSVAKLQATANAVPGLIEHIEIKSRENKGHGASCIEGYRAAIDRGIPWVFQIDSDGQCDPQFFGELWSRRNEFDVLYGCRVQRDDGYFRALASSVLKLVLRISQGVNCADANSPYRLMRSDIIEKHLPQAEQVHLANVALAVSLQREKGTRHTSTPIRFRQRIGGRSSPRPWHFASQACRLIRQINSSHGIPAPSRNE